jgi:hypothetical protein
MAAGYPLYVDRPAGRGSRAAISLPFVVAAALDVGFELAAAGAQFVEHHVSAGS